MYTCEGVGQGGGERDLLITVFGYCNCSMHEGWTGSKDSILYKHFIIVCSLEIATATE